MICYRYNPEIKQYEEYQPTSEVEEKELLEAELRQLRGLLHSAFMADRLTESEARKVPMWERRVREITCRLAELDAETIREAKDKGAW